MNKLLWLLSPVFCSTMLFACATCTATDSGTFTLADFNAPDSVANVDHENQSRVLDVDLSQTTNTIDQSPALRYTATMAGPDAGWASVSFPLTSDTVSKLTMFYAVRFQAAGITNTRNIYLTLIDADGTRWNTIEHLTSEWQSFSCKFSDFRWQSGRGDASRDLYAMLPSLQRLEIYFSNRFEGANGMMLDNVQLVKGCKPYEIVCTETSTPLNIIVQKPFSLHLEAREKESHALATSATSFLTVSSDSPQYLLVKDRVPMTNGQAQLDLFVRKLGMYKLTVEDAVLSVPLTLDIMGFVDGPRIETRIGMERDMTYAQVQTQTRYKVTVDNIGTAQLQSVHLTVRDSLGRAVVERNDSLHDLGTGRVRMMFPMPGLYEGEVSVLSDAPEALPQENSVNQFLSLSKAEENKTTNTLASVSLPDGVTSTICTGFLTFLESLPTTATVVARDKFPIVVIAPAAFENMKWGHPFAIAGTGLFALNKEQFDTEGKLRVTWHNRLGARWVRDDFARPAIEPWRGAYDWERFDRSVLLYREAHLKVLASLTSPALWSDGEPPVTNDERELWREWVRTMAEHSGSKVMAWEPWPESNTERAWGKYPDPFGYRELMRSTWDGLRQAGNEYAPNYQVVGGATVGTDSIFFDSIMTSGFSQFLNIVSFRPKPLRNDKSPIWNDLPKVIDTLRTSMKRAGLLGDKITEQWITSIGWNTGKHGASMQQQARWLTQSFIIALSQKVDKIFWSNLVDDGIQTCGLFTDKWEVKPAAIAFNFLQYQMSQTTPRNIAKQGDATVYEFDIQRHSARWEGKMFVAWTDKPGHEQDIIIKGQQKKCYAHNYLGAELFPTLVSEQATNGTESGTVKTYRLKIGNDPVYIWDVGQAPKRNVPIKPENATTATQQKTPFEDTAEPVTDFQVTKD